jgi:cytochrome c biogenesis protein CcdA
MRGNVQLAIIHQLFLVLISFCIASDVQADDVWVASDTAGQPQVQLYFFWSLTCPHCTSAHPHVVAIPKQRPWVKVHELELSRSQPNVAHYQALAHRIGENASSVPAVIFCGEMHVGWEGPENSGRLLNERLDACRARLVAGQSTTDGAPASGRIDIPLFGTVDPSTISLPTLTLVLAGLDAFNPCAFFVLLFLLSMMAHQKSRSRMLLIGGVFVAISGIMYFAFMAAWLSVFQLFGHLSWVTLAAGALAILVGLTNIKDFFWFARGFSLSIPESKKPDVFRRARAILNAEQLPAMFAATAFLAVAANFYELLCTAGFPMIYTRVLTLAELPAGTRYVYLAAYNIIYVLPLAAIVAVFARTLGARKLSEREGRLLKLLSGLMMLGLGVLLLLAPERLSQTGLTLGLMAIAVAITWVASMSSKDKT